jgi:hypothetical protein
MRQRIASDTTYTFAADFKRNDQIDDFIVFFTLVISIIIFTQTTPITSGLANIIIFLQFCKITTYNSNFSNRMKNEGID